MPVCSGVELMDKIKQKGADCEFVIVSAHKEFEEARSFFKMEGFDYLIKPVSDHELQALLSKLSGKIAIKKTPQLPDGTPSPELNKIVGYLPS